MNLKAFHVLFIAVSTLLAVLLGVWCLGRYSVQDGRAVLASAIGSFGAAVALLLYGVWFFRKARHL